MDRKEQLLAAIKAKDAAQVEALLTNEPALIQTETPAGSLILTAVYSGAREVAQILLRFNPDVNIFEAASVGSAERIKTLLADNPELAQAADAQGFSPLGLAAFFGHAAAAKALLDGGADINRIMESKARFVPSNTALHAAVAGGPHREVIELLVTAGANVNKLDSNGHTPLHSAAFHNDLQVIAYLLEHGADVNHHADGAPTPLAYALQHGKAAQADALRAAGGVE